MSNFQLNLPIDIPWKRICVDKDMLDDKICDVKRPKRWSSSIAIFEYQPEDDYQSYEGMLLTYIKVVCSITGYQAGPDEIGLHKGGFDHYWKDNKDFFKQTLLDYYACYGAILEVAVAPSNREMPLSKYPYFADFEPKKRELYEVVTETGEVMSRSLKDLSVGKGNSTLRSHEVLDVDHGTSVAGNVSTPYGGGGFSYSHSGEWGTKDMSQEDANNLRTTDESQESRETESHTTQLTQLYHQLDSYHLGTNRAVFFVLPRPHTVQTEFTFVNGPRNIEGIQEFFFVVLRPKDVEKICVEAYLETGHIAKIPIMGYDEAIESTDTITLKVHSDFRGEDPDKLDFNNDDNSRIWVEEGSYPYNPPPGWVIDLSKGNGGYSYSSVTGEGKGVNFDDDDEQNIPGVFEYDVTEIDENHLVLWGKVSAAFTDNFGDNKVWPGDLEVTLTIYLKKVNPKQSIKGYEEHLFLTARDLCCCEDRDLRGPFISWERPFSVSSVREKTIGDVMSIKEANIYGKLMGKEFVKSRNDIDHRYESSKVQIYQTHFFSSMLANSVRGRQADTRVGKIDHLDERIKEKIQKFSPTIRLSNLLSMPAQQQMDLYGLSSEEVSQLRTSLTAINSKAGDPRLKWLTPGQQEAYLGKKKKTDDRGKSK